MNYRLTPAQIAVIYDCPTCGADVHEHNDYHRTERGICSKGAHSARIAAIESLVTQIVAEERRRAERPFRHWPRSRHEWFLWATGRWGR